MLSWGTQKEQREKQACPYSVSTTPIGLPTCQSFLFSFPSIEVTFLWSVRKEISQEYLNSMYCILLSSPWLATSHKKNTLSVETTTKPGTKDCAAHLRTGEQRKAEGAENKVLTSTAARALGGQECTKPLQTLGVPMANTQGGKERQQEGKKPWPLRTSSPLKGATHRLTCLPSP